MGNKQKTWLLIAVILVVAGCVLFTAAANGIDWDLTKLSTVTYETNTHPVQDAFHSISIQTDTADIEVVSAADGICKVVCREPENARHVVIVKGDTLTIREEDQRKWYDHIGIFLGAPKITVYLPESAYETLTIQEDTGAVQIANAFRFARIDISVTTGDVKNYASASDAVKIRTDTGSISVSGISTGELELSVTTGKVEISDTGCETLASHGDTGKITLKDVIATESISITRSTGDIRFDRCDAGQILVKTDTGDVTGSFLSGKDFDVHSDTGYTRYPKDSTGGKCEVRTDTGNIQLTVQ